MISTFRRLFPILCLALLGTTSLSVAAEERTWQPVQPPQPTQVQPGRIEVLEFFWYGCPHCYAMEPYVDKWLATKPADVDFVRVPGVLNQMWMAHARAYFTAQKLGVLDKIHKPLFDAIHRERRNILTEDDLREFFEETGVKPADFDRVYRSHETEIRLKQAYVLAQNYRITGVPAFIVNGRYMTSGQLAGTYENIITTINDLVAKERGGGALAAP
jgi:thiol:disulfide interchange protein DsbA